MEDSKRKSIMIGVIVTCLVLAGIITYATRSKRAGSIESIKPGQMIWVKCRNPDCETEYQMDKKVYFKTLQEIRDPMMMTAPGLACKECGEESVYRAVKCAKCGLMFERGTVGGDFADRCPECAHSTIEETRKEAAQRK